MPIVFSAAQGNQLAVSDVDALSGTGEMTVTLLATHGTVVVSSLAGGNIASGGNGPGTLVVDGYLVALDAALAVASKVDAWLDRGGAYPFSDTAASSPSEDDMRRTQGFASLVCALLGNDVDPTDMISVRVAIAWALAWGVLGRALACGETLSLIHI